MTALTKTASTEIALTDDISDEALARLTGQASSGDQDRLPRARINLLHDDDQGNTYPAGTFAVTVDGREVFSKTATFRVYYRGFQYQHYLDKKNDPEGKGRYVNQSIIIPDIFMEAPDEKGGMKCGKLTAKQKKQGMTPEQEALQNQLKCVQLLYGTISFPKGGVTAGRIDNEDAVEKVDNVTEIPCVFKLPQSSFMAVSEAIEGLQKAGKAMQKYPLSFSLKRAQNGTTTYYKIEPSVDTLKPSPFDIELLKQFLAQVKHINDRILEKHNAALNGEETDQDKEDQKTFDPDLDDEIPF